MGACAGSARPMAVSLANYYPGMKPAAWNQSRILWDVVPKQIYSCVYCWQSSGNFPINKKPDVSLAIGTFYLTENVEHT
jgi:hypothetical protein